MTPTHRITVEVVLTAGVEEPLACLASIVLSALYEADIAVERAEIEEVQQ